ncbi:MULTISPECIES: OsmC family protein [unclassified Duganella]|jgi:putative redox protein|uniref:OsmC family protein n=1 Tax=unclassified Duganella TaxID=2636909 RepID=UPI00088084EC|nr:MULTISPECIES: OsmC family protein [unclassified Duganella]SDG78448.1 putative redox protein [Duganella sp. OV458]SDK05421.1 putative redox protein [Duganella sp. OV510]
MARGSAHIGSDTYTTQIEVGGHALTGDEPARNGGHDAGPAPYDFLLAGLASCTAITLRMYADRKQWPVTAVGVDLHLTHAEDGSMLIRRTLAISGEVDAAQKARMSEIAEKTPVTLTLKAGMRIDTQLV